VFVSDDDDDDVELLSDVLKDKKKAEEVQNRPGLRYFKCPICFDQPEIVGVTPCGKILLLNMLIKRGRN
jgi:hypothetical protein